MRSGRLLWRSLFGALLIEPNARQPKMFSSGLEKVWIRSLNVAARALGTCFGLGGLGCVVSAARDPDHRAGYMLLGLPLVAVGIATWFARPITQSSLDRIRDGRQSEESD
jgi:hypothetical protein